MLHLYYKYFGKHRKTALEFANFDFCLYKEIKNVLKRKKEETFIDYERFTEEYSNYISYLNKFEDEGKDCIAYLRVKKWKNKIKILKRLKSEVVQDISNKN